MEFLSLILNLSFSPLLQFSSIVFSPLLSFFITFLIIQRLLTIFRNDQYLISIRNLGSNLCDVHLLLKENASKQDLLFGLIHSYIVRYAMKVKGYSGRSKLNILEKLNLKDEITSESSFDILVRARELLHNNGEVDFTADNLNENKNKTKNRESNVLRNGISSNVENFHHNESRNDFPHPPSGSGSEDVKHMHHDDYNDNYNYFNNNNRSVGLVTVKEILASQWLVEELLLETRHARLEVRNTQFRSK